MALLPGRFMRRSLLAGALITFVLVPVGPALGQNPYQSTPQARRGYRGTVAPCAAGVTPTLGTFAPATGTSPNTSTTANVNVVLDSALRVLGFKFSPDLIQSGDIMATIPAKGLPFVPAPGDKLVIPQGTFAVKEVKPTWAGSVAVLYEMLVRL